MKTLVCLLLIFLSFESEAGEWIFRHIDAHIAMRDAIIRQDREGIWEHTHHTVHENAGVLAWQIRQRYKNLTESQQLELQKRLGFEETKILNIEAKDILVSKFFLEHHSYMLEDADSQLTGRALGKLLQLGPKMSGGIFIYKNDPKRKRLLPYAYTISGNDACDYRAVLEIPSLENVLGPFSVSPKTFSF